MGVMSSRSLIQIHLTPVAAHNLSTGVDIGIVLGVLAVLLLAVLAIVLHLRSKALQFDPQHENSFSHEDVYGHSASCNSAEFIPDISEINRVRRGSAISRADLEMRNLRASFTGPTAVTRNSLVITRTSLGFDGDMISTTFSNIHTKGAEQGTNVMRS